MHIRFGRAAIRSGWRRALSYGGAVALATAALSAPAAVAAAATTTSGEFVTVGGGIDCEGTPSSNAGLPTGATATLSRTAGALTVNLDLSPLPVQAYSVEIFEAVASGCGSDDNAAVGSASGGSTASLTLPLPYPTLGGQVLGDGLGSENAVIVLDDRGSSCGCGDTYVTTVPLPPPPSQQALVTLSSNTADAAYGEAVTVTATVAAPGAVTTPTGTIAFGVNGIQTIVPLDSSGTASFVLPSDLDPGSYDVTADYPGDSTYQPASAPPLAEAVQQASTTTSLSSSGNPVLTGSQGEITAAVAVSAPGAGTPTGSIVFTVDGTAQAPVALTDGAATLPLASLAIGTHSVTAAYSGDTDFAASDSSSLSQTIQQVTSTTLTVSPNGGVFEHQPVTLTAVESPLLAGTIQFYDGDDLLGAPATVTSANDSVSLITSDLTPGSHTFKAVFTPSTDGYLPSTSDAVGYEVTALPVAIDQTITKNGTGPVTTAPFSTTGPRLLLAFTSSDGPATKQTTTVTGGGLTWTLVRRANAKGGTAEIWSAYAPGPLTNATVTSTQKTGGFDQSLTVLSFTDSLGVGASAGASRARVAPAVSLTTTAPGSLVIGVGEDYTAAIARTPTTGQHLVTQWVDPGPGETFWVQDMATTTANSGTVVTLSDKAPTADTWNFAAVEVLQEPS